MQHISRLFKNPLFRNIDIRIIVLLNLITFVLIYTWFRSQTILATAEEGIPVYNSLQTLNGVRGIWQNISLGYSSPFTIPLTTLFGFFVFLESIGFYPWLSQAILFYLYIVTALLSVYFLCQTLLGKNYRWVIGFLASCFYLCNLYTYSQVFGRFIYPLIALWAFLPLFTYLWIRWLQTTKLAYIVFIVISTIFFSNIFALPSSVIALWLPASLYTLFDIGKSKNKIKKMLSAMSVFAVWVFSNIWWMYPLWIFRHGSSLGGFSGQSNLQSLQDVSKFFPLDQIIFLKQSFLFGATNFWGFFYSQPKPYLISLTIFILTMIGIWASRKYVTWKYLLLLLFVSLLLIKGTNPPFGEETYKFLFSTIPIFQVLRNPYEKIGVAFLLPYAIFFGIGVAWIDLKLKRFTLPIVTAVSITVFIYLLQPLWNGDVFPGYVHVMVPIEYKLANQYIITNTKGRIFSLPFLNGSSAKFKWGYQGEEPSEYLFTRAVVSKVINVPVIDKFYPLLQLYLPSKNFTNLLSIMSVDSIILHDDLELTPYYQYNWSSSQKLIQGWQHINPPHTFGNLTVYTLQKGQRLNEVYGLAHIAAVHTIEELFNTVVTDTFNPHTDGLVYVEEKPILSLARELAIPNLSYRKISPDKYMVHITNVKKPYIIVLSSNFDPMWQATAGKGKFTKHFLINGYANGWLIDKKGTYDIEISFRP